jgi:TolA-binding protein
MSLSKVLSTAVVLLAIAPTPGCFVLQKDHEAVAAQAAEAEKNAGAARAEVLALRADLEATRQRLDNALRANADSSSETMTTKQRLNDLAGRVDEANHGIDELRRDVTASRTEIYARLDDLKRSQQPAPAVAPPPPTPIPQDKSAHFQKLEEAHAKKDWVTVRALSPEYVNRYPADDKADEALFFEGDGDLADGRPSSALGTFNRLLKLFPRTNMLDRTLLGMGDAYMMMHDCANAKLAFDACEKRFAKEKIGAEARSRLGLIAKNPPGTCAPP